MTKKEKITYGVWAAIIIGGIILLYFLFRNSNNDNGVDLKSEIEKKEAEIRTIQELRYKDSLLIIEKDKRIQERSESDAVLKTVDGILRKQYNSNAAKHKTNKTDYEKVPSDVNSMSADSLKRAIADFYK